MSSLIGNFVPTTTAFDQTEDKPAKTRNNKEDPLNRKHAQP